jgi:hypothetical protein
MATKPEDTLFRIRFYHEENVYEIYARSLAQESIFGFLEVEELVFSDTTSNLVVDPTEEKLRKEFEGVICTYIPMHAIIRIDEVKKQGIAKMSDAPKGVKNNILRPFPAHVYNKSKAPE